MSSSSMNVDQRIVQMQFDNAQFERGVNSTLGTLDKLKNSLNFSGQASSLSNLSSTIGRFTTAPLVSSLETAKSGFSALEVVAITAISNITTRIQMMGERLVSSITIDPMKTGWSEYEEKMDSIKTILNSAKDKNGAAVSLDTVKRKIEDLNVYADKTIYSFADMTNNIGKFTNAGVDLDTATAAIQGVANAAAAAGADSNAASRAMYNFAQALSLGYVQRMDWKSIENANMATVEFKDELLKTAIQMGTVKKVSEGMYTSVTEGSKKAKDASTAAAMFTDNLKDKWLTNDVLIETLNRYSDTSTEIGKKAQEAATKVFTLSKMFDTLGEAMQSGWSATWEKIVGDYEQAGDLFTGINNYISGIMDASANKRVDFLDKVMNQFGSKNITEADWDLFASGQKKDSLQEYIEIVKKVAKEHNVDVESMIKNNKTFKASLREGWFTQEIFDDVNRYIDGMKASKKAGKGVYTKEQVSILKGITSGLKEAGSAYAGLHKETGKISKKDWNAFASTQSQKDLETYMKVVKKVAKENNIDIDSMIKKKGDFEKSLKKGWFDRDLFDQVNKYIDGLSTAKKEGKGDYTADQVKSLKRLTRSLKDTNSAYSKLQKEQMHTGRELIIDSFLNVFNQITRITRTARKAYGDIFPKSTPKQIYDILKRINDLTKGFKLSSATIKGFRNTFRGLFSLLDIVKMALVSIGKGFFTVFKSLTRFGGSILGTTSSIGSSITALHDWIKSSKIFDNAVSSVVNVVLTLVEAVDALHIFDAIKVGISIVVGLLARLVVYGLQLINVILASKAFAAVTRLIYRLLIGILTVIGNIVPFVMNLVDQVSSLGSVGKGVSAIKDFFKTIGSYAYKGVISVLEGLADFIEYVSSSDGIKYISEVLTGAVSSIIEHIASGISKVRKFVGELLKLESVQKIVKNVQTFFSNFGDTLVKIGKGGIEKIQEFFSWIGSKLPDSSKVLEIINGLLDGTVDRAKFLKETVGNIGDGLGTVGTKIKEFLSQKVTLPGFGKEAKDASKDGGMLAEAGEAVKKGLTTFANKVKEGLSAIVDGKFIGIMSWLTTLYILFSIGRLISSLGKMFRSFGVGKDSPVGKFLLSFSKSLNASARQANANAFETIAKGIGIITLCIIALTQLDTRKVSDVAISLFFVLFGVRLVITALAKLFDSKTEDINGNPLEEAITSLTETFTRSLKKAMKLISVGTTMAAVAAGVFLLIGAFIKIYNVLTDKDFNPKAMAAAVGILVGFLLALFVSLAVIQNNKFDASMGLAATIVGIAAAIYILVEAMKAVPSDLAKTVKQLFGLVGVFAILLGSMYILKKIGQDGTSLVALAGTMILLAVAINLLVVPLALLAVIPSDRIIGIGFALLMLSAGMVALMAAGKYFGKGSAGNILIMAIAIGVLCGSLKLLGDVDTDKLKTVGIVLGILMAALLAFGLLGRLVAPGLASLGIALIGLGVVMAGFGVGLYFLVKAIGALGPALDSFITGFIEFSKKLRDNAATIAAGVTAVIGIILGAIIAKKVLFSKAAFTLFSSLFTGGSKALLEFLPKSKVLLVAGIFTLLGVIDSVLPGAIDMLVGMLGKGMIALGRALMTHSGTIATGVRAIISGLIVVCFEILAELVRWVQDTLNSWFGTDFKIGDGLKEKADKYRDDMLAKLDASEDINKETEKNKEAMDKWQESLVPSKDTAAPTPGVDALIPGNGLIPGTITGKSKEETDKENYDAGSSGVMSFITGAKNTWTSQGGMDFITNGLKGFMDDSGALDSARLGGIDFTNAFNSGIDLTSVLGNKGSEGYKELESKIGGDNMKTLVDQMNKSVEENTNFDAIPKKAKEAKEQADKITKDVGKDDGKEQKITKKATLKMDVKSDNSSSNATMKSSAEGAASLWQKTFANKQSSIKNTVTNTMKSAAKGAGASSVYSSFRSSAIDSANGILSGLESKMDDMYQKGYKLGEKVDQGYRAGQRIQSPSKVMFKNAVYSILGLLNGFESKSSDLFRAGESMGYSVNSGAKRALAQMSSSLTDGIDSTPTIRPVLDLSNVKAGAKSINGMFGARTLSVGSANVNQLATSMNARQNGIDPVALAISDLGKAISAQQQPSNTYNINGVTYDDGSNIANAIGMLAHAAVVEGRA